MERAEILGWLVESREDELERLWSGADRTRQGAVGAEVHLRGLIEISNHCVRQCHYCGLRAGHHGLPRYRMTGEEIIDCAHQALRFGYGTVVLQAGEDPGLTLEWMADLVRRIKRETRLAVTLSLGERSLEELTAWREAGADRYLLRFETSNRDLFERLHPPLSDRPGADRVTLLEALRHLGYEIGSGVMVGLPGQSREDLADDLELFRELDLDMIGIGPYLPHPATPLGAEAGAAPRPEEQVPNSELMTYKLIALARLVCPEANIPSTTALATLNLAHGRELGLQRGANILMPNLTPARYRVRYEIYPNKACLRETAGQCRSCIRNRLESIGRCAGRGQGPAVSMARRNMAQAGRN